MDEATVSILLRMKQEGLDALSDVAAKLGDVRTQALEAAAALGVLAGAQTAQAVTSTVATTASQNWFQSLIGGIPVIGNFLTSVGSIPVVGWPAVAVIIALSAALIVGAASFLAALITVTAAVGTLVTTTVIGFAAMAAAWTLALGPLALLTAGVILLADRMFTTGKTTVDPLLAFEQALGKMADTWGKAATPMANQFLAALMPLVPLITQVGLQLLEWFGTRIPQVLSFARDSFYLLFSTITALGTPIGYFIDQMATRWPQLTPIVQFFAAQFIQAVMGMLTNLLAFMDWFIKEWPKLAPIVGSILQQAGTFIQWFAGEAKKLVDWFVANWPMIATTAQNLLPVFQTLWFLVDKLVQVFILLTLTYDKIVEFLRGVKKEVDIVAAAWDRLNNLISIAARMFGAFGGGGISGGFNPSDRIPINWQGPPGGPVGEGSFGAPGGRMQWGGIVPGPMGAPTMAVVHGGERVIPVGGAGGMNDTNELLVAILQVLNARLQPQGMTVRAYASRA